MIKTIIIDDQILLREMMKTMLLQDKEIEVVACGGNGNEAIQLCKTYQPDIVLMDIKMPDLDGVKALIAIKKEYPKTKVIMLTTFEDTESITDAYCNGADGYLLKDIKPDLLILAVKCIYNDLYIMGKSVHQYIMQQFTIASGNKITISTPPPESLEGNLLHAEVDLDKIDLKIIRHLSEGIGNRNIAELMNFSEGTVKNRISRILSITGLNDRTQLVVYALKNNLI